MNKSMGAVLEQRTAAISLIFHIPYLESHTLGSMFYGTSGRGGRSNHRYRWAEYCSVFLFLVLLVSLYLLFGEGMEQLGGALTCGGRYGKEEC